jgi:hypothetical protein
LAVLPKDPKYSSLQETEDLSTKTIMSLRCKPILVLNAFKFAGACQISGGFMQMVIELLTIPRDIVLDWTVGEGSSYLAGDYCGRFVIGLEDRVEFEGEAQNVCERVNSIDRSKKKVDKGKAVVLCPSKAAKKSNEERDPFASIKTLGGEEDESTE